jgi:hypothetical protein
MSTLGTMKTRIADEIVRDDLSSQIANAITTAIAVWSPTRFHFNEKRYSLSTVASTEYYALSSLTNTDGSALDTDETLVEIDSVTLTYNNQPYPLWDMTQQAVDREQSPSSLYTGQPSAYAIFADQIRLHPIPDAAYSCTLSGLARLGTLSSDAATNAWMTTGEALIRNQAKLIIYRDIVRDMDGVALAKDALREALEPLQRRMAAKVVTGRIAPWVL